MVNKPPQKVLTISADRRNAAKVIVHAATNSFADAAAKAERALSEFRVSGAPSNITFLRALLKDPAILAGSMHTRYIDENVGALIHAEPETGR